MSAANPPPGRTEPSPIEFAGISWLVKASSDPVGPGPNRFSAANVTVDRAGHLKLAISRASLGWTCAEVIAKGEFGYGSYTWAVATDVTRLDPDVVLGMFTWSDEPEQANRELDIELSRWGRAVDPQTGSFTVQAAAGPVSHRFPAAPGRSHHTLVWRKGSVEFRTRTGLITKAWSHEGREVPTPGGGVVPRINLWLFGGQAPRTPQSVTLESFKFRADAGDSQPR